MNWDIDLGENSKKELPLDGRKSISILLGAGFSVPKGYPTGVKVNNSLLNFDQYPISFGISGEMLISNRSNQLQDDWPENDYQKQFKFCKRLISLYAQEHGEFDYEAFYDFIKSKDVFLPKYKELGKVFVKTESEYNHYVSCIDSIYNQMVSYLIHDTEGESWYDEEPSRIGYVDGYDSFLKVLKNWSGDYIINVHTLNHDLVFESFRKTEYLSGLISDGFDEYGSQYYGIVKRGNASFHVRLERYKGRYTTPIRLYKLHGSLDYVLYKRTEDNCVLVPDNYVKIRKYINPGYLMRGRGSKIGYEQYPFAVHADFLTGTNYKIHRYGEPLLYKKLFKRFKANLRKAEMLIIIGYGCKDSKINEMICKNFDFRRTPIYIFDPKPSDALKAFASQTKAKVMVKSVTEMEQSDLK